MPNAILTETLAFFLPGRAKDLSARLYNGPHKVNQFQSNPATPHFINVVFPISQFQLAHLLKPDYLSNQSLAVHCCVATHRPLIAILFVNEASGG